MRSFIVMAMFTASLASAAWNDYEEIQELDLESRGIQSLQIDAGAGSMEIMGFPGVDRIMVTATIQVPTESDDRARAIIDEHLTLSLERNGAVAELKSYFDDSVWRSDDRGSVRIEVRMPEGMSLAIDDSSGSIVIERVHGNIDARDSSGSISMSDVGGNVHIDDSSGSITVEGVGNDLSIEDGSGSITVSGVGGSVVIDDGSGSIRVSDVEKNLIIENAGSGSVKFSNIRGTVQHDS